ncbi:hypothetical protein QBC45DRAFT_446680 [Copromyces sp. CBS 386.78]|nr:hypothetical protein QBC45DRAFT_446680 [Copromyces sp. CBS 386.78]
MDSRQTAKLTLPGFFEIWLRCLTIVLCDLGWIGMVVAYVALGSVAQAILTLLGPAIVDLVDFCVSTLTVLVGDDEVVGRGSRNTPTRKSVRFADGCKDPMPAQPEALNRVAAWRAIRLEALAPREDLLATTRTLRTQLAAFRLSEANRREELQLGGRQSRSRSGTTRRVSSDARPATRLGSFDSRRVRSDSFRSARFGSLDRQ